MGHTSTGNAALLSMTLLSGLSIHALALAEPVNVNIVSGAADRYWEVYDAAGHRISDGEGVPIPPENVCLNDKSPPRCPTGAVKYGHLSPGSWPTSLDAIPGATWMWAPGITGESSPASNAAFTFKHEFPLCNPRGDGTIYLAADDSAKVSINGISVIATSSNQLASGSFPKNSLHGAGFPIQMNLIEVTAKNAYLEWCDPTKSKGAKDNYQCNPAGVVFGASFPDDAPSCTGSKGEIIRSGETEHNCPPGQTGSTGFVIAAPSFP